MNQAYGFARSKGVSLDSNPVTMDFSPLRNRIYELKAIRLVHILIPTHVK